METTPLEFQSEALRIGENFLHSMDVVNHTLQYVWETILCQNAMISWISDCSSVITNYNP